MNAPPTWDRALRAELVAAAARAQRRRRQRPLRGAAAAAVGLVVLGIISLGPREAAASIDVERSGDRVIVTLLELQEDPQKVEADLRAAGFDVAIELVPAGPSAVGRFVGATESGNLPTELEPLDPSGTSFAAFSVPHDWAGSLRLHVGRPARPGEGYLGFSDALAPGEPLQCLAIVGARAEAAVAAVAGRPARVDFRRLDIPDTAPLTAEDLGGRFAAWTVFRADAIAPEQVIVWLVPPTGDPAPTSGGPVACGP